LESNFLDIGQLLRDLRWLLQSPSVLAPNMESNGLTDPGMVGAPGTLTASQKQWLDQLAEDPQLLEKHFAHYDTRRLGKYAEQLMLFWLQHAPDIDFLDHSVQVKSARGKQTLGEVDFLFESEGRAIHLELAVKFYVAIENGNRLDRYYGPNPHDRLDLKWKKMYDRQSQWLQSPLNTHRYKFDSQLSDHRLNQKWYNYLMMKGILFAHWKRSDALKLPSEINPNAHWGQWCYGSEWSGLLANHHDGEKWMELPKLRWMSPARVYETDPLKSQQEAKGEWSDSKRARMVAAMKRNAQGEWKESQRCVIVPDHWPRQK
jgi:hypothetical protein